ncbi:MAG TPA: YceK/YidQ family lipoprotein [Myxococcota bacterium]|nr:YceK/YidQ family lipoprotein [Myxococcota bacterium]
MSRARAFALAAALCATGCMTIDTQYDAGYDGPAVYSGTRKDASIFSGALLDFSIPWIVISLVDFPFSAIADTVLLPVTIPRDKERSAKQVEENRVDAERASTIQPHPGEPPAGTAARLFTECAALLKQESPHFADCYSIDAKVEITGSDPLRGADYKPVLRQGLERWRSSGDTIEWRNPSYATDGDHVRISAQRAVSTSGTRLPVSLIVGPGPDGQWRILEEISPGVTNP